MTTYTFAPTVFTVLRLDVLADGKACWLATNPEISAVYGTGATQGDALLDLERARESFLSVLTRQGRPLPALTAKAVLVVIESADAAEPQAVSRSIFTNDQINQVVAR